MRRIDYNTRAHNKCAYCTESKGCYCKQKQCIYPPVKKKQTGYPWEAVFR